MTERWVCVLSLARLNPCDKQTVKLLKLVCKVAKKVFFQKHHRKKKYTYIYVTSERDQQHGWYYADLWDH